MMVRIAGFFWLGVCVCSLGKSAKTWRQKTMRARIVLVGVGGGEAGGEAGGGGRGEGGGVRGADGQGGGRGLAVAWPCRADVMKHRAVASELFVCTWAQ